MQNSISYKKKLTPFFIVFILINSFLLLFQKRLQQFNINADVVIIANLILFFISITSIVIHKKAIENKSPNAVVRSMMMVTLFKLIVVATSVIIYVVAAGKNRNANGVFCGMAIYLLYAFIEVRITSKMRKENGNN